jgi:hypothetical protein
MHSSTKWYRYQDSLGGDDWGTHVSVHLFEYTVVKETPKGVWLALFEFSSLKRFVLLDARKKFACPTKEEAMESFLARKRKQVKILSNQLRHVKEAIQIAEDLCRKISPEETLSVF